MIGATCPWSCAHRAAQRRAFWQALGDLEAEQRATEIDGGIGVAAVTAIAAVPPGLPRELEAVRWVRRAEQLGLENIAMVLSRGMTVDELEAHTTLLVAIERRRESFA